MIIEQLLNFLEILLLIFGVLGFILVPALVKALQEFKKLHRLFTEYRSSESKGGEKITTDELIMLIEQSGVLFRTFSKMFKISY